MSEEKPKRYKRISQSITEIVQSKKTTQGRGSFTGFKSLEPYISFVKGHVTTLYGSAGSGKSQIAIEFSVYAAIAYQQKTVLYLTETGDFAEVVLDICQTYLRKRLDNITDEELLSSLSFLDEYFFVIDISSSLLNVREIYEDVLSIQKEYSVTIDNVIIDHYLNLRPCAEQKGMTIAESVRFIFQAITRTSKKYNFHTTILFHTKDIEPIKCPHTGKSYLPKGEPYQLTGGMQSFYLSEQMIGVYRPISREEQYGILNPATGTPFELNEMHVTCMKVKPKKSGSLGGSILHFDWERQAYWELYEGRKYYAGEWYQEHNGIKPSALKPNRSFDDSEESIF